MSKRRLPEIKEVKAIVKTLDPGRRYTGYCVINKNEKWTVSYEYYCNIHFADMDYPYPEKIVEISEQHCLSQNELYMMQMGIFEGIFHQYIYKDGVKIDALLHRGPGEVEGKIGTVFQGICTLPDPHLFRVYWFEMMVAKDQTFIALDPQFQGFPGYILEDFLGEQSVHLIENETIVAKRALHTKTLKERTKK